MKLIALDAAQAELEDAQAYYLQRTTPGIAAAFVADYEHSASRILQFPQAGPRFPHAYAPCHRPPTPPAKVLGRAALILTFS